jgi:hypothetical protein
MTTLIGADTAILLGGDGAALLDATGEWSGPKPNFFCTEITAYAPASAAAAYALGWATSAWGTLTELPQSYAASTILLASDMGYRTDPTDASGVIAYPPIVAEAFAIDRAINLDLNASNIAASWGAIQFSNADRSFDGIVAAWNNDGRAARVLWGQKTLENFVGYRSGRTTSGLYRDYAGTWQSAAAGTVRVDYSTGVPVALNEAASTNLVSNPRFEGASAGTPGTVPTSMTMTGSVSGLTRTIVGVGTVNGLPYIDVRYAGTTSASSVLNLTYSTYTLLNLSAGQHLVQGAWVAIVGGTTTGLTFKHWGIIYDNAVVTRLDDQTQFFPSAVLTRVQRAITVPSTGTPPYKQTNAAFLLYFANATAVNCTLRIAAPQWEVGTTLSSPILPPVASPAQTLRDADRLYTARQIYQDPIYAMLTSIFTGVSTAWSLTDTVLTVPLRDATYWLERPAQTSQYQGSGTYEGTASLAGTTKPKTRGTAYNVSPILVDPANLVYQYSDGPGTVTTLYEGGAANRTFQADTANLYAGSTTSGLYRTDNSRGLFQLGNTPTGAITADVTGAFPSAGNKTVLADIARYLLSEDLSVPSANINTASFTAAATAYPYAGGIHIAGAESVDGLTAVDRVLSGFGAALYPARDGTLHVLVLSRPAVGTTPTAMYSAANAVSVTPISPPASLWPPPYRVQVGYQHNYTVQASGLLGAATSTHKQFVAQADRYAGAVSSTVQTSYARPNDLAPIRASLNTQANAQSVATALMALYGTRLRLYAVVLPFEIGIQREIGDIVQIVWPMDNLDGGQLGTVVGDSLRSNDATVTLQVLV